MYSDASPSRADWWEQSRWRLFLDFHTPDHADQMPPGSPPAFGKLDVGEIVSSAAHAGVDALVFPAKDNQGNVFYPTSLAHQLSDLAGRDLVAEFVDASHARGIRAVAYFQPIRDRRAFEERPDWRQINNDGSERVLQPWMGTGGHHLVCPLGEAGQVALEQLRELLERYPVDGVWWDRVGDVQGADERFGCFCASCVERCRTEAGVELAREARWGDPDWRAFWRWRAEALLRFQEDAHRVVRGANRDVCLISNYAFFGMALADPVPLSVDMEAIADATDVFCIEFQHWRSFLAMSTNSRLAAALTDRPAELIMWNIGRIADGVTRSPAFTEAAAHTFLAHGHAANFHDAVFHDGTVDGRLWELIGDVTERARELAPALEHAEPLRYAAVLFSPSTFTWYGRGQPDAYVREFVGTVRQMLGLHVPLEVVSERHLTAEGLEGLQLLVVPDAACLSDGACAVLERWVAAGGVLVASHHTSLYDETGRRREDFGLAALLGVSYADDAPPGARWMRSRPGRPDRWWDGHPVGLRAPTAFVKQAEGTEVLAELGEPNRALEVFTHVIPAAERWTHPAVTLHDHAKGHAIYLAGCLGAAHLQSGVPELSAVLEVGTELVPPPIRADAPASVELVARARPDEWVVHLVNLQGELARTHRMPSLAAVVQGVSEVVPVRDVLLRTDHPVASAREILDGADLDVVHVGGGSKVLLPELRVSACVRIQLA